MSMSDAQRTAHIKAYAGIAATTLPTKFKIGLSSSQPTGTGGNVTEPIGNNYSRVVTGDQGGAEPMSDYWEHDVSFGAGVVKNKLQILFPTPSGEWFSSSVPAAYLVIYDESDVFAGWGDLDQTYAIGINNTVDFAVRDLQLKLNAA